MKIVKDFGEKKLIRNILVPLLGDKIGDDCAIIDLQNKYLVVTIDKIPEVPIAFELGLMGYYDMGYYLAVANLSDVASMGADPLGFIAATIVPANFYVSDFKKLVKGINDACINHNTKFIGGDTGEASKISLVGSAFGIVEKNKVLRRNTANINDVLYTTGKIGLFSTALMYFLVAKPQGLNLSTGEERLLKLKLIHPLAKFEEGMLLSNSRGCTSCMDITDGFTMSIFELIKANKKGFLVFENKLPISKTTIAVADFLHINPIKLAFGAGADYELIGTIRKKKQESIKKLFRKNKKDFFVFGKVIKKEAFVLKRKGGFLENICISGWQHFVGDAKEVVKQQFRGSSNE